MKFLEYTAQEQNDLSSKEHTKKGVCLVEFGDSFCSDVVLLHIKLSRSCLTALLII
jgi:hypothetical protein